MTSRATAWPREHPRRAKAAIVAAIAIAIAITVILPFAVEPETRHLSAWGQERGDLARFREELSTARAETRALATSAYLLGAIQDPRGHVLFVFGVERAYTDGERAAIHRFVREGGVLVLANDVSHGTALSREFGAIYGDLAVLDRNSYRGEPAAPIVEVPFQGSAFRVVMNSPAFIAVLDPATANVLAWSSNESFLDVDGDGVLEVNRTLSDVPGPFPLALNATYGAGEVLMFADPNMFDDEHLALAGFDNAALARAIVSAYGGAGVTALVDESRHAAPATSRAGSEAVRLLVLATTTPRVGVALGSLALVAAFAAAYLTRGTEDWSVHAFTIGEERRAPAALAPTPERLRALAARAISERYNLPMEYLESASVDDLARVTGDREIAAVAKGAERAKDARALYDKLTLDVPVQVPVQEVPT